MALCSSPVSHILRFTMTPSATNYTIWSVCMKNYLLGQDLWDIIEESSEAKPEDSEADSRTRRKKNAIALLAIQNSCEQDIIFPIREITSAKSAWDTLAKIYGPEPPIVISVQPGVHNQFQPLCNAIKKGDWVHVKNFIDLNPDAVNAEITSTGRTAFHVACEAGHLKIIDKLVKCMSKADLVKQDQVGETALHLACEASHLKIIEKLVKLMSETDLVKQNQLGETALFNVARAGITKIAECMIKKNKNLACIQDDQGLLPVTIASTLCHKDMTRYLYSVTPYDLLFLENDNQGIELLSYSIRSKIYDVAFDLLGHCWRLTTTRIVRGTIPLVRLASMPLAFRSGSRLTFWQRWIYSCIRVPLPTTSNEVQAQLPTASSEFRGNISQNGQSERDNNIRLPALNQRRRLVSNLLKFIGIKEIYDMKRTHLHALELLRFMCQELSISNLDAERDAVFVATKHGIIEFIIEMVKIDFNVLYRKNDSRLTIFMSGIVHRQEKVISLLYGLGARKHFFTSLHDKSNNNMLHLAGKLAPASQLARISGAALQMQRELQWFKEVENMSNPSLKEYLNCDGDKPRQVFTKNHKDLVKKGEKWMKETATSCTVVGALIITIMFAAAFTVPGGNDQNTGFPIFLHEKSFMVFIISNAISLFSSSTSVLMFLGILTSRYAEDDFLKSLPTKLIVGLSTLFLSIAAMMVAFSAALLIMLKGQLHIAIPIVSLASIPVTLYLCLQVPLLVEIFLSTYGPSIFDRKMKPWL